MNKVIGVKTDCPHFLNVGNVCSRVDNMARCDEYSECEFKYIDALKEENRQMKEKLEKIKEVAKECSIHNACISDCAYFEHCDGCVTNLFLQIIEGAEDEN